MLELWHFHRRALVVSGAILAALIILLAALAVVVRAAGGHTDSAPARHEQTPVPQHPASTPSRAAASDVADWNAKAAVVPAVSQPYPAITGEALSDPSAFAEAFVTELFTRDYLHSTRQQLLGWAQYEDAPLRSPNYPQSDWTKVLVDSVSDLTWDGETDTPIPADGPWLALHAEQARQVVSDVVVRTDPQWQSQIAGGYEPPDRLATVRDVTFTLTQQVHVAGHLETSRYEASLSVQLGTSSRGDYGVAATNNFVVKAVV